jgi:hypothetical protein
MSQAIADEHSELRWCNAADLAGLSLADPALLGVLLSSLHDR